MTAAETPHEIRLVVNGDELRLSVPARLTLVDVLRDRLGLVGTHVGCEQGACGACTVLIDGHPVRACLQLAVQVDGRNVETVELLGDADEEPDSLQEAFLRRRAFQCGFCTPGFLMLGLSLQRRSCTPTRGEIVEFISGNLCRCTGYEDIVEAIADACAETDIAGHSE